MHKKVLKCIEGLMDRKQAISTFKSEKFEILSITIDELNLPGAYKNKVYSKFQK